MNITFVDLISTSSLCEESLPFSCLQFSLNFFKSVWARPACGVPWVWRSQRRQYHCWLWQCLCRTPGAVQTFNNSWLGLSFSPPKAFFLSPLLFAIFFPPLAFFLPFDLFFSSIYTSSSFPPSLSVFWLLLFNYSFHVPLPSFALSLDYLKFTAFRPKFSPLFPFQSHNEPSAEPHINAFPLLCHSND